MVYLVSANRLFTQETPLCTSLRPPPPETIGIILMRRCHLLTVFMVRFTSSESFRRHAASLQENEKKINRVLTMPPSYVGQSKTEQDCGNKSATALKISMLWRKPQNTPNISLFLTGRATRLTNTGKPQLTLGI